MNEILQIVYIIAVTLVSLSFHEFAHAFVSYRLGDPTAKNQGRLTLNPVKHLDPIGTIMMVASMFSGYGIGWAKPVPINPMYYRNRKLGTMLTSIAGPLSNLLLAFLFIFPLVNAMISGGGDIVATNAFNEKLINISKLFVRTNIGLAIFNLLPVPPLDGSKILSGILPTRQYFKFMQYENYIGIAFILLIFIFPGILSGVLGFIINPVLNLMVSSVYGIFMLFM